MTNVTEPTLAQAWTAALKLCHHEPGGHLGTTCVTFSTVPASAMEKAAEEKLDAFLLAHGCISIQTVANTIFPLSVWRWSGGDRHRFYRRYYEMWPHIRRAHGNRRGVYFHRLVDFRHGSGGDPVNQLENIIATWKRGNHRFSALQAAVYDPSRDFSNAMQLGFPCLQQIAFRPHETSDGKQLDVIAFYANQLLVEKAYGNYLGLYRLGQFMASEMGLGLCQVSCIAGALKLSDGRSKSSLASLVRKVSEVTDVQ